MSEPRDSRLGHVLVLGGLGLALGKALLVDLEASGRSLLLGLTLLALTEACVPWRARGPRAQARRGIQAGLLALNALLVGPGSPASWGERAALVLAGLAAIATTLSLARAARAPAPTSAPASPGTRQTLRVGLGATLALLGLAALASAVVPERRVALEPAAIQPWNGHDHLVAFPRFTLARIPDEAVLLEDGAPLPFPQATHDAIAELGSGRYQACGGRLVHLSSSDGADPRTAHRYELVFVPDLLRSAPVVLLGALALVLALLGASAGALSLATPASPRARGALVLAVALVLLAGNARSWDSLALSWDTQSYVSHSATRSPLYPWFLDALDARPGEPRVLEPASPLHQDPHHRFLGAARAQRVLAVLGLAALVWEASALVPLALLAILLGLGGISDLATWGDRALHASAGTLQTEGFTQPFVFLFAALVLAHARRPRWRTAVGLAGTLSLLVLARPSNTALLVAWPFVFALDARALGARPALRRALVLALVYAAPLVLVAGWTWSRSGHFRIGAITGTNVFGTAFELAEPGDVASLEDPRARALLQKCLESPVQRLAPDDLDFPDHNIYAIGFPTLATLPDAPRGPWADHEADDLLLSVGKSLLRRHPGAFARQVLREVGWLLDEAVVPLLVAAALALLLAWREGEPAFLAYAFLASLPFVTVLPACFFHVPKGRYRASWGFVESAFVPLLAALVVGARARLSAREGTTAASGAPARSPAP